MSMGVTFVDDLSHLFHLVNELTAEEDISSRRPFILLPPKPW